MTGQEMDVLRTPWGGPWSLHRGGRGRLLSTILESKILLYGMPLRCDSTDLCTLEKRTRNLRLYILRSGGGSELWGYWIRLWVSHGIESWKYALSMSPCGPTWSLCAFQLPVFFGDHPALQLPLNRGSETLWRHLTVEVKPHRHSNCLETKTVHLSYLAWTVMEDKTLTATWIDLRCFLD